MIKWFFNDHIAHKFFRVSRICRHGGSRIARESMSECVGRLADGREEKELIMWTLAWMHTRDESAQRGNENYQNLRWLFENWELLICALQLILNGNGSTGTELLFMISNSSAQCEWKIQLFSSIHFGWISNSHHLLHCTTWHGIINSQRESASSSKKEFHRCFYIFHVQFNSTSTHNTTTSCVCMCDRETKAKKEEPKKPIK